MNFLKFMRGRQTDDNIVNRAKCKCNTLIRKFQFCGGNIMYDGQMLLLCILFVSCIGNRSEDDKNARVICY